MRWDIEGFYSWTASDGFGRGSYGVTGERGRATAHLAAAVGGLAPGAVRVHRDVDTGAITIERGDA
jgi:hypothetical protein